MVNSPYCFPRGEEVLYLQFRIYDGGREQEDGGYIFQNETVDRRGGA